MRNMKKLLSMLLALAMIFSLSVTAFADEVTEEPTQPTYSITIENNAAGHTYEAYQIFTGTLAKEAGNDAAAGTNAVLSDIQWGNGVSDYGKTTLQTKYAVNSAAALAELLNSGNIKDFVTEVSKYLTTAAASDDSVEDGKYVLSGLAAGYYLVKDQSESLNGMNDAYTSYILEVVENSTVTPKSSVPEIEKKVKDINDSTESELSGWQDSADHDIGDTVPFQLKATLASNLENYLKYKVVFHDTMSAGLTFDGIVSVKIINGNGDPITLTTEQYSVVTATLKDNAETENFVEGTALTITIEDVKGLGALNDAVVIVEYNAILNENAVLGAPGNPNVVYLEYSNNPNWGWDVWEDEDGDNEWDEDETPDDEEDEDDDEDTGKTPEDKVIVFTYKLDVNKITKDDEGNEIALEGATFTLEKKLENGSWKTIELTVAGNVFTAKGLDDGIYRLTETVAPEGYNQLTAPIYFKVEATHDKEAKDPALQTLTVTLIDEEGNVIADVQDGNLGSFTADKTTGFIATKVINNAGIILPETGGMGTTLIYMVGAFMVLCATVLLVTKRRMVA